MGGAIVSPFACCLLLLFELQAAASLSSVDCVGCLLPSNLKTLAPV